MEKKEYKQPEIKVVEIEETCWDNMSKQDPDGEIGAKGGSLDFSTED